MKIAINNDTTIDLATLIDTRLLVQANSGGGKSWLLRRILEQSHGKVQQIILDLEGEFSTLREKYDYILVGKDGDLEVDVKSASLLARKLLELNVSSIVDLYELNHYERKEFVKFFLSSMVNAPKELWHSCLVVIDEAHVFCPEKGESVAAESVIDLATRGRKRGYAAILATQRLSKLSKDAAAECNNKLIGRTGLDVDMKRASEELGFSSKEQYLSLRSLEAGEFFAFGPAISKEVIKVKVGEVGTTHPKAGSRILTNTVPPTEKIKSILSQLKDIPKQAKKEKETIEDLQQEIRELKKNVGTPGIPEKITQEQLNKLIEPHLIAFRSVEKGYKNKIQQWETYAHKLLQSVNDLAEGLRNITKPDEGAGVSYSPLPEDINLKKFNEERDFLDEERDKLFKLHDNKPIDEGITPRGGAKRMLQVLVSRYPMKFTKAQLATLSGLSARSGTYGTYLSLLRSGNLIELQDDLIAITQKGIEVAGGIPTTREKQNTVEMWRNNLVGGARRMFDYLVEVYPKSFSKEFVALETDLTASSGTFGTYLSMLRKNGLVESKDGELKASDSLFL